MKVLLSSPPLNKPGLRVSFPYDETLVAAVRSVPGRVYSQMGRYWTVPKTPEAVADLAKRLPRNAELVLAPDVAEYLRTRELALDGAAATKRRGDASIAFPFLTAPYAHQRAGLDFLVKLGSGALLWEMGLGKTKTAIDYAEWLAARSENVFRVLVICPNTVKRNWVAEVAKHAGHANVVIPEGPLKERAVQLGSTMYTVVNCESLSLAPLNQAIADFRWDLVIVDESTRFKNGKAKRTKMLHKIKAARRVILTGSPITGSPEDAWAQFEFVEPGIFGSWWSFSDRYLAKDFFGNVVGLKAGMAEPLKARIESRGYRILKADVLDLPPKVYETRTVQLAGDQKRAYDQMREELRVAIEGQPLATASTILTQLLRLTQITAGLIGEGDRYGWLENNAKVAELDDLLLDELAGEQVVVFGIYQRELEELAARYTEGALVPVRAIHGPGYIVDGDFGKARDRSVELPIIYGPTPEKRRAALIEEFQRGQRRLLFIQSRTGGIGINLTAAKTAIYYTRGWSLEEYIQSQDRLHRIGQTGTVTILHLVAERTVDEEIAKALSTKQSLADMLTGDDARKLAARVLGR